MLPCFECFDCALAPEFELSRPTGAASRVQSLPKTNPGFSASRVPSLHGSDPTVSGVLSRLCTGVPLPSKQGLLGSPRQLMLPLALGYCKFFACFPELDQSYRGLPVLDSRTAPESRPYQLSVTDLQSTSSAVDSAS